MGPTSQDIYDAVVVGAGPGGLTAATYLARFRRRVVALDGGPPRAAWIPHSHNTPGLLGVSGSDLLARLRDQACSFGAEVRPGLAQTLVRSKDAFTIRTDREPLRARCILLTTGVRDRIPAIAGIEPAIRRGLVRLCPICDGYEGIDRRILVLGEGARAKAEAAFLSAYSDQVTLMPTGDGTVPLDGLQLDEREVRVTSPSGEVQRFDCLYLALGCTPQSGLAAACGAALDPNGGVLVDDHQMSTVPGLYAAGDVVRGLNQIAVATGEAAIAATGIHNRLRGANS